MTVRRWFWVFAILAAIGLLAPIRVGDLAGYDDAYYAQVAKDILRTGDWLNVRSNGYQALEHPPLFVWMQAALFTVAGMSDFLAKLPSALCGLGVILLTPWVARKLLGDDLRALLSMFIMAATPYFIKYAARGMTDVPFTFFTLAAIACWLLTEEDPRWYLATGLCTAACLMTRGIVGLGLPAIFAIHAWIARRKVPGTYAAAALLLSFAPLLGWFAELYIVHGERLFIQYKAWLDLKLAGESLPGWRRFTGVPEYLWMLTKSYWPWLPFLAIGLVEVVRGRDRRQNLLTVWAVVMFLMCAAAGSRILRYMLPAYPAFSLFAAIGLAKVVPERFVIKGFQILTPLLGVAVLAIAIRPPVTWHAQEIVPIALAANAAPVDQRVGFFDKGDLRFDEVNQLAWYGDRLFLVIQFPDQLKEALAKRDLRVFILDNVAYQQFVARSMPHQVLARSGSLVCLRLD